MRASNISALVVKDVVRTEGNTAAGMFTERDVVRAIAEYGAAGAHMKVAQFVSTFAGTGVLRVRAITLAHVRHPHEPAPHPSSAGNRQLQPDRRHQHARHLERVRRRGHGHANRLCRLKRSPGARTSSDCIEGLSAAAETKASVLHDRVVPAALVPGRLLPGITSSCPPKSENTARGSSRAGETKKAGHDQNAIHRTRRRRASDRPGWYAVGGSCGVVAAAVANAGAYGFYHPALTQLTPADLANEIADARSDRQAVRGEPGRSCRRSTRRRMTSTAR